MASVAEFPMLGNPEYPTTDGKPMAETDWHRDLMLDLIETLKVWYEAQQRVYVSGNLLLFYVRGNKRRHISPDVFVVKGVPKGQRLNYILWEEGKPPAFALELTSSSTRREDTARKFRLYRDELKVKEYFLFDPCQDYLKPPLQGYRLRGGEYHGVRWVDGRLPSRELGLHLEQDGKALRLYDPASGCWLPTQRERVALEKAAREQAEAAQEQAEAARKQAEAIVQQEQLARRRTEAEVEDLRRQIEELRRRLPGLV
jgi:Uma2 family endonuclease